MTYRNRIQTLRVLSGSHHVLHNSTKLSAIYGEFTRIELSSRLSNDRAWLLSVLHTTRALDTILKELLIAKAWAGNVHGLGQYMDALEKNGALQPGQNIQFKKEIAYKRNWYMHEAGAMPTKVEAARILSEMHTLLTVVLGRV